MNKKIAVISDFDGTISKKDFFWYAIECYLTPDDLEPWKEFEQGKIHHIQALARIFEKIKIHKDEFDKFILTLPIEEAFVDTVNLCVSKNIPFYVVSAGADYYIKKIFKTLNVENMITLISNSSHFSKEEGLVFEELNPESEFYSITHGTSKLKVVKKLKRQGYNCIYCGDGIPDFEAAKEADVVFARGSLKKLCNEANIPTLDFSTYSDIYQYVKNL